MSFWVLISQWAESSNKSLIVHNPGEDSGVLGSTEVSLNNYYFKHFFFNVGLPGCVDFFFFKQCSQWYVFIMTLEWNSFPGEWERVKVPNNFRAREGIVWFWPWGRFPAGNGQRFALDLYKNPTSLKIWRFCFLCSQILENVNVVLSRGWKDANVDWPLWWGLVVIWEEMTYPHLA